MANRFSGSHCSSEIHTKIYQKFHFYRAPGSTSYTPTQGAYNYGTPQRAAGYPDQTAGYTAASQTYPRKHLVKSCISRYVFSTLQCYF